MLAIAHRSQVKRAAPQSLFAAIEPAGDEIPPQPDAALAATIETWIVPARVFGGACETPHQALVCRVQRARDAAILDA
jgi:hypothetical protein